MEPTKEPLTAEQTIEQPSEAPILRRSTRSKKHKRKRKVPVGTWLCYLLACTLIASGVTISAYVTTTTDSDSARAAKFDVDVQAADTAAMTFNENGTQAEQETQTYTFTVTSNSEVAVDYAVKVTFQTPPPANMSLQMDDNEAIPCDGVKTEYTFTGSRYNIGDGTKGHKLHIIVDYVTEDGKLIEVEKFINTVAVDIVAEQQMSA